MAKKGKGTTVAVEEDQSVQQQGTQVETNASVREDIMLNGFEGLHELEAELEAAIEKHIEPIKKILTKDRKKLCADLTMKWADIKPLFELEKRALAARAMEDADAGDAVLSNIQEAVNYLTKGQNLDFLEVLFNTEVQERAPDYIAGKDDFEDAQSGPEKVQAAQDGNGSGTPA